jgi:hypothetical protein
MRSGDDDDPGPGRRYRPSRTAFRVLLQPEELRFQDEQEIYGIAELPVSW